MRSKSVAQPQKKKTTLGELRTAMGHKQIEPPEPSNAGMVHSKKEQLAITLLKRLKYLDGILDNSKLSQEFQQEARQEKKKIYEGVED